ncbi:C5a anaphylatoxin chemotactic receptor 1-like [Suncus etruscus]|uniref:C5a anaphylatoxin chemotactic receptor 1-like n=1 Tax=Suncus etruscus TaxID=109475 RepID=UPI0021105E97|nr:C5a anaphylatoxin chemotactic receptor 1-like [Suncus etruscus]
MPTNRGHLPDDLEHPGGTTEDRGEAWQQRNAGWTPTPPLRGRGGQLEKTTTRGLSQHPRNPGLREGEESENISEIEFNHYDNMTWDGQHDPPSLQAQRSVVMVIYVVVFVVGVPGNLLVLWVTGSQVRQSINAIWFLNLAVADLLSCLALPIIIATIMHGRWLLGKMGCHILPLLLYFNLYASVLLLTTISADRFLIVFKPIWCRNYRVARLAWLASGVAWMLALVLTIPSFVFVEGYEDPVSKDVFCFVDFVTDSAALTVTVMRFVLTFLGPLVTMSVCYTLLLLRTWRRPATRSTKTLKMVVAVVTSFFVLWLPFHFSDLLFVFFPSLSSNMELVVSLYIIGTALAYTNCCINPIIYVAAMGLWGQHIRFWLGRLRQLLTEG